MKFNELDEELHSHAKILMDRAFDKLSDAKKEEFKKLLEQGY